MRKSAPAVSYPVGRSRFEGALLLAVALAGGAACLAWSWQAGAVGWRQGLMLAALLIGLAAAGWRWWHTPAGLLQWDREAWQCTWVQGLAKAELLLDLQAVALLRLADDAGRTLAWTWAEQWRQPAHWLALRRALVSGSRRQLPPQAGEPA